MKSHQVSGQFSKLTSNLDLSTEWKKKLDQVLSALLVVEPYWEIARYPVKGKKGPKDFDRADAEEAIEKAEFVVKTVKEFLKEKYNF